MSDAIPMRIPCPDCGILHIDEGEFATKPHHTHSCQACGLTWRPAIVHTVGVRFLPGFKNSEMPIVKPPEKLKVEPRFTWSHASPNCDNHCDCYEEALKQHGELNR